MGKKRPRQREREERREREKEKEREEDWEREREKNREMFTIKKGGRVLYSSPSKYLQSSQQRSVSFLNPLYTT